MVDDGTMLHCCCCLTKRVAMCCRTVLMDLLCWRWLRDEVERVATAKSSRHHESSQPPRQHPHHPNPLAIATRPPATSLPLSSCCGKPPLHEADDVELLQVQLAGRRSPSSSRVAVLAISLPSVFLRIVARCFRILRSNVVTSSAGKNRNARFPLLQTFPDALPITSRSASRDFSLYLPGL